MPVNITLEFVQQLIIERKLNMDKIVIAGSGGLVREIKALIDRINLKNARYEFVGYVVNDRVGDDVFGNDDFLCNYGSPLNVVIAVGDMKLRKKLSEIYGKNKNLMFPNIIDPSVIIIGEMNIGQGNIICAGTVFSIDVKIHNFSLINMGCTIAHDDEVEDFVSINPGCNLSGGVHICSLTEIGTGTQIVQGKKVGSNVDVWAGSTVIKDIPDDCLVFGVPARIVRRKDG